MEYQQPLLRYPHSNNSLLSSGNAKKSTAYEPRTEAISPAINDDIINAEDSVSKITKDEQALIVEKLKKVEAEIIQTDLQIVRLRKQREQLEQAQAAPKHDDDQENVCDTKQLSIAKLVYHENRTKAQKAHAKLDCLGGSTDLPMYNQPSDNMVYHQNAAKFSNPFKKSLIECFRTRYRNRLKLEDSVSAEYDKRMEKWLKSIEMEDSQPSKRMKDAKTREFFEKQFPELKKARESGERFSRVGQRVARSDAEVAELMDGITEREDQDKKVKSYAVIPPMLEEMRSRKPKFINYNGYVEDIVANYKEYQILNTWTDEEKEIFRENYLQHPKDFGLISRMTSRKTVADCVQYYYLSKKSENFKQLLKRQQKRRTRSFVRPAATTPANPESLNNESSGKSNGIGNDNNQSGGDATSADQTNGFKSSTAGDAYTNIKKESLDGNESTPDYVNENIEICCICKCDFSDSNQFRNVTRSNYQLYGIDPETLKPGMKICYPCRFRHVKHPNFDEPIMEQDVTMMEDDKKPTGRQDQHTNNVTLMDIDMNNQNNSTNHPNSAVIKMNTDELVNLSEKNENLKPSNLTNNHHNNITTAAPIDYSCRSNETSGPQRDAALNNTKPNINSLHVTNMDQPSAAVSATNASTTSTTNTNTSGTKPENAKGPQQLTFVRDIIYHAIEMSFQDKSGVPVGQQENSEQPTSAPSQQMESVPNQPPQEPATREDSRSPSEMVIDESADAPSPESNSPSKFTSQQTKQEQGSPSVES